MESWHEHMIYEFSLYKFVMWPLGSWPFTEHTIFDKFRTALLTVLQLSMVSNILMDFVGSSLDNIDVAIDRFSLTSCGCLALVKVLFIRSQRDRLSKFMRHAAIDWSTEKIDRHRDVMLRYAELGRFLFFFQLISSSLAIVAMIITPLSLPAFVYSGNGTLPNETILYAKLLPLGSSCVFVTGEQMICGLRYTLQSMQLMSTAMGNLGSDVFLYGLTFHLCGQFARLAGHMSEMGKTGKIEKEKERVVEQIRRHYLLLSLAADIESCVRIILIAQLLLSSLHSSFIGLQLSINIRMHNYAVFLRNLIALAILMMQLFFYCYMGESLSSRTEQVTKAVYLSDWYNLPTNTIKVLCFVIARANVPFHVTAGSVYQMNLNNFKNIVKAWISYISVLQLVFKE